MNGLTVNGLSQIVKFAGPAVMAAIASWVGVRVSIAEIRGDMINIRAEMVGMKAMAEDRAEVIADHEARVRVIEERLLRLEVISGAKVDPGR